jgi:hypothetical protein
MIHVCTPFARDKNLANAYNAAFERCPDGDWLCVRDQDTMFLTSDAINIMYEYVERFPDTGLFTSFTNRIHPLAQDQLFLGVPSEDFDIKSWNYRAKIQALSETKVTEIKRPISGFLMLISKKVWNSIKFRGVGCLGVDNNFSADVLMSGKKIYRMDRLIVFHIYRLDNIKNKSHLLH